MDRAALWAWSAQWKEHSADGERQTTGTRSNGGEWNDNFPKEISKCQLASYFNVHSKVKPQRISACLVTISNTWSLSAGSRVVAAGDWFLRSQQLQFNSESWRSATRQSQFSEVRNQQHSAAPAVWRGSPQIHFEIPGPMTWGFFFLFFVFFSRWVILEPP